MKDELPKGVYYDAKRNSNRYRVRLYVNQQVIHLSYHQTKESALAAYERAKAMREAYLKDPVTLENTLDQIDALNRRLL